MFKKTETTPQYELFSTPFTQFGKRGSKKYDDPKAWHNQFHRNVISKIDESIFSPLFNKGNMGAPNASIRVIIGMSLIKEGFGCSDEDLFEKCEFNLLVRKALGESRNTLLNPKLCKLVDVFEQEDAQKMVYRLSSQSIEDKLYSLGLLIYQVLKRLNEKTIGYDFLHRVFHEQYEVVKGVAIPRPKNEISAQSVQNHNDPDVTYRKKGDQKVKGYSVNITETCNEKDDQDSKPNLIVDVQVKPVSAADNDYVQDAVTHIQNNVTDDKTEKLYADGAYQSPYNRNFADTNHIELMITGLQGRLSIYNLKMKDGNLIVTNLATGEIIPANQTGDKWRINTNGKCKYKYFTVQQIENSALKRKLATIPIEEQMKRNNVEATMFQYCFHSKNNKTRYRGMLKHKLYSYARCLWMNHVRLMIYLITTCQGTTENGSKANFRNIKNSIMEIH